MPALNNAALLTMASADVANNFTLPSGLSLGWLLAMNPADVMVAYGPVVLGALAPTSRGAGSGNFTLTVTGSNFAPGAVIYFAGVAQTTVFDSAQQLHCTIAGSAITSTGAKAITVQNSNGIVSNSVNFTVSVAPTISSLSPNTIAHGNATFTLTVNGANYQSGAVASFAGTALVTTFVSAAQLTAVVSAALVASAGSAAVIVTNPDGGASSSSTFTIS